MDAERHRVHAYGQVWTSWTEWTLWCVHTVHEVHFVHTRNFLKESWYIKYFDLPYAH
jgi:hypothetical protein